MNKTWRIFNWIFSFFCFLAAVSYGMCAASILFCITGIISLPISAVLESWQRYTKKSIRPLAIGIVFLGAILITPSEDVIDDNISTETIIAENFEEKKDAVLLDTETEIVENTSESESESTSISEKINPLPEVTIENIPEYTGTPYVTINNNLPYFSESEITQAVNSYETYSELDSLGRCGACTASVGQDIMPTEERGSIGSVKPTGWHTVKYEGVDGNYLYNRCHLLGYQLTGENANTKNLITGTRYMNVEGMLPFENMVADYVKETGNHVLLRVTPVFKENNLLAEGVLMEAQSVEDRGNGILFCVFCYNVQPGIVIDYATGESYEEEAETSAENISAETNANAADSVNNNSADTAGEINQENSTAAQTQNDVNAVSDTSVTTMVWLSATGSKYHSINNCGSMNPDKAVQVTEEQAIERGMGKCSKCW